MCPGRTTRSNLRAAIPGALTALLLITSSGSPYATDLQRFEFAQPHMGTTWRVVLYAPDAATAADASRAAFARIAQLDAAFSDYRRDSELTRLVEDGVRRPVRVSPELFQILSISDAMAAQTGGAFDVAAGALTHEWRRARRLGIVPTARDIRAAVAVSGRQFVELDPSGRTVRLLVPGVKLDLGGIAKGYAADRALQQLSASGAPRALVAGGGDIAAGDSPPGARGWELALSPLDGEPAPEGPMMLTRAGISTSGDTEQWLESDGTRYSHIVDPRTGRALTERRLVTVVASDATTSDMLATAVSVLGPREGLRLIEQTPGTAALIGTSHGGAVKWVKSGNWPQR